MKITYNAWHELDLLFILFDVIIFINEKKREIPW